MRLITSTILIFNIHVYIYELSHIYRILIKKLYTECPRQLFGNFWQLFW